MFRVREILVLEVHADIRYHKERLNLNISKVSPVRHPDTKPIQNMFSGI
jgi:hypothetical protein